MKLGEIVTRKTVAAVLPATAKPQVIERLVDVLVKSGTLPAARREVVLQALAAREREMTTGVGLGIALPHARIAGVDRILAALGTCPAGIDFDSLDGQPATIFVLLVAPEDMRKEHVQTLSEVSRLLGNAESRAALLAAKTDSELWQALQDAERKTAKRR